MSDLAKAMPAPADDDPTPAPGATPSGVGAAETRRSRQVPLDWGGLERALLRPIPGVVTCLDTHAGDVVELIDGWSEDHGFSEQELAEGLASGRLIRIEPLPQETVQGWMVTFVAELEDGWARDALQQALAGLLPIRLFEETLGRFPQERLAWLARREARQAAVLRAWVEAKDIAPTTARPSSRLLT
jgi:hypothetical protein